MLKKKPTTSLTQKLYSAEQVRMHEKEAAKNLGIDMFSLMLRAGACVYQQSATLFPNLNNYLVVVGNGNNAGDGYVAALNAHNAGKQVTVCAVEPSRQAQGDLERAQQNWLAAGGKVQDFDEAHLDKADIVIDALLGTGVSGAIRKPYANIINFINNSNKPIISIDVPSGLDASTGSAAQECVQATATVTFVGVKLGLTTGAGKQACGELIFDGLGIASAFSQLARSDASALDIEDFRGLGPRSLNSHKGSYGRLLCIGGNEGMSGAIRMTSEAALRTGAGLVKVYTHANSIQQVCIGRPELMVSSKGLNDSLAWATCIVIGPGLGQDEWSKSTFDTVMHHCQKTSKPVVIDADGLNLTAASARFMALTNCVITPHVGEASRLLKVSIEEIEANRFNYARQCAQRYNATCVLKGAGSIVANQDQLMVCRHGNPGMATAGMGDVLAGILGSLLAQGLSVDMASQFGVSIHAKAGDIVAQKFGQRGLLATDLFETVRLLIND